MVRNYSTGGGHLPGDTLVEGDGKIVTQKWQGYPPENLKVVGKPMPPMPEVAIPRFTARPCMPAACWCPICCMQNPHIPHPHARIKSLILPRPRDAGRGLHPHLQERPSIIRCRKSSISRRLAPRCRDTEDLAEDARCSDRVSTTFFLSHPRCSR
jgi:hypothetical protein